MATFDQVSPLRIDREVGTNYQILRIAGIFDLFSEPTFRTVLAKCVAEGPQNLILDFTAVDAIDSSAIGALVNLGQQIQQNEGTLQIVGGSFVERVVKSLRLGRFLSLQPSLDGAIENCDRCY